VVQDLQDLMTVYCVMRSRDEVAAKALLRQMTKEVDQESARVLLGKAVGLLGEGDREWVKGLF
jgi:hypothetical protein